jgi:beta-glucosidase
MKKSVFILLFLLSFISSSAKDKGKGKPQGKPVDINALLSKMTLEEKVGQMAQICIDVVTVQHNYVAQEPVRLNEEILREALVKWHVGSILNASNNRARSCDTWQALIGRIQEISTKETRLGIPCIYGIDAIHGTTYTAGATLFPQEIAMAATWNRQLVLDGARICAYETRASNIPWTFSPVLDLGINPCWPRFWETFGEDNYLAAEMGRQMVRGYEGNDIGDKYHIAACIKHFLGYSAPVSGKDRTPAYIPEYLLRQVHLPSFAAAVREGAHSVMINSGLINDYPVHGNKHIITDILKNELQFKGLVVSDWADIENLYKRDKVASTPKEAVKIAINAGIDMSMIPYNFDFCKYLVELVKEGQVPMSRIDDAVRRILQVKKELGLFKHPMMKMSDYPLFGSKEHSRKAYEAATECITLLKNDSGILPLSKDKKVLIAGPNANSMRTLLGGWSYSWQGEKVDEFSQNLHTILQAVTAKIGADHVTYVPGVEYKMDGKV